MHGFAKFPLAPMDGVMRAMTLVALPLPLVFVALGAVVPSGGPVPGDRAMLVMGLFMLLTFAVVWLAFRPSEFDVSPAGLKVKWALRERHVLPTEITGARLVNKDQFRAEFGYGLRIGVGGLWGGFGLLKTAKTTFTMYVSRTDEFVIVETKGRPWLVTPGDPAKFVALIHEIKRG